MYEAIVGSRMRENPRTVLGGVFFKCYFEREVNLLMKFLKVHGLGNDFILLEKEAYLGKNLSDLSIRLCNRNLGIGADGLLLVVEPQNKDADIGMRIINSDGSEAEMCGNGIRCFARYVYERGLINKESFSIETKAGIMRPKLNIHNGNIISVQIDMGKVILNRTAIPVLGAGDNVINEPITLLDGTRVMITTVLMGVPHTVIFVKEITESLVCELGAKIEKATIFPKHTNVNFVIIKNQHEIIVRTWERGAGATLACGTGCCASVVAACLNGYLNHKAIVHVQEGDLEIEYLQNGHVLMTGPTKFVYEGNLIDNF